MIRRSKATSTLPSSNCSGIENADNEVLEGSSEFDNIDRRKISKKENRHYFLKSTTTVRCIFFVVVASFTFQLDAFVREYQGPLDHISTTILKPYYDLSCPSFSSFHVDEKTSENGGGNIASWDCDIIMGKNESNRGVDYSSKASFPRIFMIGARDETQDTFQTWQSQLFPNSETKSPDDLSSSRPYLERINTLKVSNLFATSGGALRESGVSSSSTPLRLTFPNSETTLFTESAKDQKQFLCRKIKWEHRLFYVYQHIFTDLLTKYPNDDGFVIIEDDAILLSTTALAEEVCNVQHQKIQFYSLYKSPLQNRQQWLRNRNSKQTSCMYRHGTVAFYIRRQMMEQIVNEHRRSFFCRFPIDMYISKFGPWFATRREVVGHLGRGRIGSF